MSEELLLEKWVPVVPTRPVAGVTVFDSRVIRMSKAEAAELRLMKTRWVEVRYDPEAKLLVFLPRKRAKKGVVPIRHHRATSSVRLMNFSPGVDIGKVSRFTAWYDSALRLPVIAFSHPIRRGRPSNNEERVH